MRGIWYSLFLHIFIVIQHPIKYRKAWNKQKAESTNSLSTYNLIAGITFLFWLISFFMSFFTWTFTRDLQKKVIITTVLIKSSNDAWNFTRMIEHMSIFTFANMFPYINWPSTETAPPHPNKFSWFQSILEMK